MKKRNEGSLNINQYSVGYLHIFRDLLILICQHGGGGGRARKWQAKHLKLIFLRWGIWKGGGNSKVSGCKSEDFIIGYNNKQGMFPHTRCIWQGQIKLTISLPNLSFGSHFLDVLSLLSVYTSQESITMKEIIQVDFSSAFLSFSLEYMITCLGWSNP